MTRYFLFLAGGSAARDVPRILSKYAALAMGETGMQGNGESARSYTIEHRELIAESAGLRVQTLTIGPGQCVPWHHHTRITDTFFCLEGPMVVHTRGRDFELGPGGQCAVGPGEAHMVEGKGGGRCRFAIVQGVGEYDFVPGKQGAAAAGE